MSTTCEQLAEIIPEPAVIRNQLERAETEAALLRRQLRLSLRRQREAERLRTLATETVGATAS